VVPDLSITHHVIIEFNESRAAFGYKGRTMAEQTAPRRSAEDLVFRIVGKPLFWLSLVLLVAAFPVARALRAKLPPPLPVGAPVPEFSLSDQYGHAWGSEQLRGRVWVADFIDTRCAASSLSTGNMRELQRRSRNLADALHLVSIALAPEHDTQAALLDWSKAHAANPRVWSFLVGTPGDLAPLLTAMGNPRCDSGSLVLVDGALRIRGHYRANQPDQVNTLLRDAALLINRGD